MNKYKANEGRARLVVRAAHARAWVGDLVRWHKITAWWRAECERGVVIALTCCVLGVITGGVVTAVVTRDDAAPPAPVSREENGVLHVQMFEDGSARVLSGTVTIGGERRNLTGRTFCVYGEGCTDTQVPFVIAVPPLDGHAPCWGVTAGTTVAFCGDGYTIGF